MRRCALPAAPPPLRVTGFFHVRRRPLRGESARSGRNTLGAKEAESPPHAAVCVCPVCVNRSSRRLPPPAEGEKMERIAPPRRPAEGDGGTLCGAACVGSSLGRSGTRSAQRKRRVHPTLRCGLPRVRQSEFPPPAPARRGRKNGADCPAPPRVTGVLCAAPPAWGVRSVGAEHARRKGSGESTPRCGVCLTRVRQSEFPPPAPARRRLGGDL